MQLNNKQKSYIAIIIGFVLGSLFYEIAYYLIKGAVHLKHTPFIVAGALIGSLIGIIYNRN
jgi:hypothetical protein